MCELYCLNYTFQPKTPIFFLIGKQKQIYAPPHRHLEELGEEQQQMEREFEDMYMKATDRVGKSCVSIHPRAPFLYSKFRN